MQKEHWYVITRQPTVKALTKFCVNLYTKDQQDALFIFIFIPINNLYMFRAGFCSSSLVLTIHIYYDARSTKY
jgi:predicted nucleic acid-binding Zn finger protein